MVKIASEGLDLGVLVGASELLGKADIFVVEAMVCAAHEDSVVEVIQCMAGAGYRLIDITDFNRSPKHGVLWLSELAYLRIEIGLLEAVKSYELEPRSFPRPYTSPSTFCVRNGVTPICLASLDDAQV